MGKIAQQANVPATQKYMQPTGHRSESSQGQHVFEPSQTDEIRATKRGNEKNDLNPHEGSFVK